MGKVYLTSGDDFSRINDKIKELQEEINNLSKDINGALIPAGSVLFADLEKQTKKLGYTYNITDAFTTNENFREGAGVNYGAGANVYWTVDEKWDVLAPVMVTGVKGANEQHFRQGEVSLSAEDVGALPANSPAEVADKVANPLSITLNGLDWGTFDGSEEKSLAITAETVNAVSKDMMSSVDADDPNKVPTSALVHSLVSKVGKVAYLGHLDVKNTDITVAKSKIVEFLKANAPKFGDGGYIVFDLTINNVPGLYSGGYRYGFMAGTAVYGLDGTIYASLIHTAYDQSIPLTITEISNDSVNLFFERLALYNQVLPKEVISIGTAWDKGKISAPWKIQTNVGPGVDSFVPAFTIRARDGYWTVGSYMLTGSLVFRYNQDESQGYNVELPVPTAERTL